MRLDKYLSLYTDFSRSQIQRLIKAGRVKINEEIARKADQKLFGEEKIRLDDDVIEIFNKRYIMLNKPAGFVCANKDSEHPVVLDILNITRKQELQIAGRLDLETTGLVLITDDGQWNHRITAPNRECTKIYLVTTADPININTIETFAQGVQLHGEKNLTRPAQLDIIEFFG